MYFILSYGQMDSQSSYEDWSIIYGPYSSKEEATERLVEVGAVRGEYAIVGGSKYKVEKSVTVTEVTE